MMRDKQVASACGSVVGSCAGSLLPMSTRPSLPLPGALVRLERAEGQCLIVFGAACAVPPPHGAPTDATAEVPPSSAQTNCSRRLCSTRPGAPLPAIFAPEGAPQPRGAPTWPPPTAPIFWDADNMQYTRANYDAIMRALAPWRTRSLDVFCSTQQFESLRNAMLKRPLASFAPGGIRADEDVNTWRLPPGGVMHMPLHSGMHPEKTLTDMQMAVTAIAALHSAPPSVVVIVTGDQDFVPLVNELKRRGHSVVVVGHQDTTSGELLSTADASLLLQQGGGGNVTKWNGAAPRQTSQARRDRGEDAQEALGSQQLQQLQQPTAAAAETEVSWWRRLLWGEAAVQAGESTGWGAANSTVQRGLHSAPSGKPAAQPGGKPPGGVNTAMDAFTASRAVTHKRAGGTPPTHGSRRRRPASTVATKDTGPDGLPTSLWTSLSQLLFGSGDAHESAAARSGVETPSRVHAHGAASKSAPQSPPASAPPAKAAAKSATPAPPAESKQSKDKATPAPPAESKQSKDNAKAVQGKGKAPAESAKGANAKKGA